MPRILIFSTAYLPLIGGAEVAIKEITDRLATEYEFLVITARLHKELPRVQRMGATVVHRIGFGNAFDKLLLPMLGLVYTLHLCRSKEPVAAWVMMVAYAGFIPYLLNLFRSKKIPIILTLQEGDSEEHIETGRGGLIAFSWRFMLSRASAVTAISTYLAARANHFGYNTAVSLIPNAVDTLQFSRIAPETLTVQANILHKKSGDIFLITTSRLVTKNAIEDIIEALTHLPPHISFLILGSGPKEQSLREQVSKLGVSSRVHFLGDVPHEEIPTYLKISDIFIRPSLSEGMGVSFLEAMAAGLPVIATQVGGISDFLFDRQRNPDKKSTGFAVDSHEPTQIAEKVLYILKHPEETLETVRNARALIEEKYDWNLIARQMKEVFVRSAYKRLS